MRGSKGASEVVFGVAATVLICGLAALTYGLSYKAGTDRLAGHLRDRLTLSHRAVESEIERFAYLPQVLGEDESVLGLLADPSEARVREVNAYLAKVTRHAQADAVYLIDPTGLALAASNWNLPSSFVGHNCGLIERLLFLSAGILLILALPWTDEIGLVAGLILVIFQIKRARSQPVAQQERPA